MKSSRWLCCWWKHYRSTWNHFDDEKPHIFVHVSRRSLPSRQKDSNFSFLGSISPSRAWFTWHPNGNTKLVCLYEESYIFSFGVFIFNSESIYYPSITFQVEVSSMIDSYNAKLIGKGFCAAGVSKIVVGSFPSLKSLECYCPKLMFLPRV